ncbi:MAG: SagB/ThcOx family dehydrogenase [Syntrophales bacterium]
MKQKKIREKEIIPMKTKSREGFFTRVLMAIILASAIIILAMPDITMAQEQKSIQLTKPQIAGNPLMEVLAKRSSSREFSAEALPENILSNMLWAAAGINRPDLGKRTAPTAMNKQEIDVYVVTASGIYLYEAKSHSLTMIVAGDMRGLTGKQDYVKGAAVNLIYVADFSRMSSAADKELYAAADTGFISENVYLYCASAGLVTVVRAYIDKPALAKAMKLRPDQKIILAQSVGYPKRGQ